MTPVIDGRTLVHPGPVAASRVTAVPCIADHRRVTLKAGTTLLQAMADVTGHAGAWFDLRDVPVATLTFVRPAPAPDDSHVAWYSDTTTLTDARILHAGGHLGRRDSTPFAHVHGIWRDTDGAHHAGHLLAEETVLAQDHVADVWILNGAFMDNVPDAETGFSLFCPTATAAVTRPNAVLAAIRPNVVIDEALARMTASTKWSDVTVKGLGSLVGTQLEGAAGLDDHATEVLLMDDAGQKVVSVGFAGPAVVGVLSSGTNRVCVTFEILALADPV